jgi:hypothetical protein
MQKIYSIPRIKKVPPNVWIFGKIEVPTTSLNKLYLYWKMILLTTECVLAKRINKGTLRAKSDTKNMTIYDFFPDKIQRL